MLKHVILLLGFVTGASEAANLKRAAVRVARVGVTVIEAERAIPDENKVVSRKQDRQIRKREEKPMVEFH
ncbi:hypothetical protein [Sphingorhabdus sp.]|uniref:hypothetical protein n=1 Tax=Sphingorhabdus sp. TaxID=1902408 RepID=UPI00391B32DE